MGNMYTPDRWVVIEITAPELSIKKVLASWYGGYLGSDSWKISSGIIETKEFDDRYEFINHSGSIYVCYKNSYGMSGYTNSVYQGLESQQKDDLKIRIDESYEPTI